MFIRKDGRTDGQSGRNMGFLLTKKAPQIEIGYIKNILLQSVKLKPPAMFLCLVQAHKVIFSYQ